MIRKLFKAVITMLVIAVTAVSNPAQAQTVVTPTSPQGWEIYTYGSPTPYGAFSTTYPHLGNGSAEIQLYDEGTSMVQYWYQLSSTVSLTSLNELSFDWYVSSTSTTPAWTTPAFGMYVTSTNGNGYLIWEGAYNGFSVAAPQDTWVSSDMLGGNFWWNSAQGSGQCANAASYNTLAWFNTNCLGGTAQVYGFSPFLGNGYEGTQFSGAFDNVQFAFTGGPDEQFNFEADRAPGDVVPEPATMTLLATGLAGMAAAQKRKKKQV